MNNIVMLQKDKNGNIYCQELNQKGIEYVKAENDEEYWDEGGTIVLDELEEILERMI